MDKPHKIRLDTEEIRGHPPVLLPVRRLQGRDLRTVLDLIGRTRRAGAASEVVGAATTRAGTEEARQIPSTGSEIVSVVVVVVGAAVAVDQLADGHRRDSLLVRIDGELVDTVKLLSLGHRQLLRSPRLQTHDLS